MTAHIQYVILVFVLTFELKFSNFLKDTVTLHSQQSAVVDNNLSKYIFT